ncbi:S1 RNA-binding domain-containing protein [Phototrophicus methaneseepsis]|uniref:S1 RNA-binding domain-containing protein n=1 Tax=Phototrophicus methaneseepsis TaxID=2710758 RepID=A0A7S8IDU1_9CHLR|nr:S1 RNA-binding domain-containing protein [Phototrophicus methaneseepsis]QPC81882.1 S1 RNA-binding domain-containing protein [Phototrophicus methaneseepsis]
MSTDVSLDTELSFDEMNFAELLEQSLAKSQLERGDIVTGVILAVDYHGLIVDVNWKHDGVVSRQDIERMGLNIEDFNIDDELDVAVVRLDDMEGNLILSAAQAKQNEDWQRAEVLQEQDEAWAGEVAAANKGGLIVPFGNLRGFIPASHVVDLPRGLNEEDRVRYLENLVGTEINVKVIEVNRKRRRLVFSQRNAERETRDARKETLLEELNEGDIRTGIVSGLCDFGAFVDLGGADGLIHISELAWHRVRHPQEIVNVGDKVEIYILHLDDRGKRIGLSLKRLQPNPWALVDEMYHIGQLVEGTVSRVEPFGAFISLEPGIEALLHVSQISDDTNEDPRRHLYEGQRVLTRVISIESDKQRLGLSLKEVTEGEHQQWEEARAEAAAAMVTQEAEEDAEPVAAD